MSQDSTRQESEEVKLDIDTLVSCIQQRIDNSPFRGYLVAGKTKGGYIFVKDVKASKSFMNRCKAFRGILEQIEQMADEAWLLLYNREGKLAQRLERLSLVMQNRQMESPCSTPV